MATWDDVSAIALGLPEVAEGTNKRGEIGWSVRGKGFAWERTLSRAMVTELGAAAPSGPVLAAMVDDLGVQQALVEAVPDVYFVVDHFRGYPAVLVRLEAVAVEDLPELLTEAWLAVAPEKLAREHFG